MPTQTFYNLPPEKRQKVVDAIRAEFSRVPYADVSINQIVKQAGIPRGSFYQYFDDKADLLVYLMADYRGHMLARARQSLEANGGDLFAMLLDIFDFTLDFAGDGQNGQLFSHVFADPARSVALLHRRTLDDGSEDAAQLARLAGLVDRHLLDIRREGDLQNMLGVLFPLTAEAFARAFLSRADRARARQDYADRLALIARGFSKNKLT